MALDTIRAVLDRRSVRAYKPQPLPDKDLKTILEAGRQAPSAANRQPWHFVVVREEARKRNLAAACSNQHWLADASVILAGVGRPGVSEKWYPVDVAIAMENMIVTATALGYGTCWIGAFDPEQVKRLLELPDGYTVVALTPIGVPADSPGARPRMPMDEFVSLDRFGQKLG